MREPPCHCSRSRVVVKENGNNLLTGSATVEIVNGTNCARPSPVAKRRSVYSRNDVLRSPENGHCCGPARSAWRNRVCEVEIAACGQLLYRHTSLALFQLNNRSRSGLSPRQRARKLRGDHHPDARRPAAGRGSRTAVMRRSCWCSFLRARQSGGRQQQVRERSAFSTCKRVLHEMKGTRRRARAPRLIGQRLRGVRARNPERIDRAAAAAWNNSTAVSPRCSATSRHPEARNLAAVRSDVRIAMPGQQLWPSTPTRGLPSHGLPGQRKRASSGRPIWRSPGADEQRSVVIGAVRA